VLPAQRRAALHRCLGQGEIELDVAHHVGAQRIGADEAETLGIGGALGGDHDPVGQRFPEQRREPPVAADRARRDARARQHQRHAAPAALVVQVRPELGLEDDRDPRPDAVEETAHRARQVIGHVAHVREPGEQRAGALRARRRHGRHDQRHPGVVPVQRAHERCRGLHLAD